MLKRRPLNKEKKGQPTQRQPQQQQPRQQAQQPQQRPAGSNAQRAGGERSSQQRSGQQGQHHGQGRRHGRHRQQGARPRRPTPPPYFQRDIVAFLSEATAQGIQEVRVKFDPMAKKVGPHVTLIYPMPKEKLAENFLSEWDRSSLPPLAQLRFRDVTIQDDKWLWLIPEADTAAAIQQWQSHALEKISAREAPQATVIPITSVHESEDHEPPHVLLGVIPRSADPDEVLKFVREKISFPLEVSVEKIALEEFSEDLQSKVLSVADK